ncbi:hypothetical protein BD410DRAFT_50473 [Rickenella mellea]|uniref:Uncharacterized protein n=1 Tax=Rickenella mellea TaxID=50990 RepID=A0A4R5XFU5_9AGAM|nr:hypothetical protein BD410DRAFT_50473 [Rickenella mellea]
MNMRGLLRHVNSFMVYTPRAGKSTSFQYQERWVYHFDKTGVRVYHAHEYVVTEIHEWALVDSNDEGTKPHSAFKSRNNFVVWATRPARERYSCWQKELDVGFYTLDNWTWSETLNVAVHAWGLDVNDPRIKLINTAFVKYGPTVQICKHAASGTLTKVVHGLKNEIQSITEYTEIRSNTNGVPKESHKWCLVFPDKNRYPQTRIVSDYVEDLLVTRLMNLDATESHAIYNPLDTLLALSNLKVRIFEEVMHSMLPGSRHTIFPIPLAGRIENYVDLTGVFYQQFQDLESLSRDFRQGVYWVPEVRSSLGNVHSVAIVKDTVYIFRITGDSTQTVQHTSLKDIQHALPQHLQSVQRWKFVWVVPNYMLKAFSDPKTIEEAGGDAWHRSLRQFVMPVVVDLDLFRRAHAARLQSTFVERLRLDDAGVDEDVN